MRLSIDQYQLTNWYQLISIFIDCVRRVIVLFPSAREFLFAEKINVRCLTNSVKLIPTTPGCLQFSSGARKDCQIPTF